MESRSDPAALGKKRTGMLIFPVTRMAKPATTATSLLKDLRSALEARADEKTRLATVSANPKSPVKTLGVRAAHVKTIAKDFHTRNRAALDYSGAVSLVDAVATRKVREEILVALDVLDRFRRDFDGALFGRLEKWSVLAEDVELADALATKVGQPLVTLDSARAAALKKWARLRSAGRRRLAVVSAQGLVSEGKREAAAALEVCEMLIDEQSPTLVPAIAQLLRETTRVDAKAVQDFLFRRSIDGNPDILRAGSENLDAARRAALIAKLEAQAGVQAQYAAAGR